MPPIEGGGIDGGIGIGAAIGGAMPPIEGGGIGMGIGIGGAMTSESKYPDWAGAAVAPTGAATLSGVRAWRKSDRNPIKSAD
jgi:hypothetical protein